MKIEIKKKFLIFRDEAKDLKKIAKKEMKRSNTISFDFSNVKFFSRSFTDELLNILANQERIKIVNLSPHLKKFLKIIKTTKFKKFAKVQ